MYLLIGSLPIVDYLYHYGNNLQIAAYTKNINTSNIKLQNKTKLCFSQMCQIYNVLLFQLFPAPVLIVPINF